MTRLTFLPLTQVIVTLFGLGFGFATAWVSFIEIVGFEKVKPYAAKWSQPFASLTEVVDTFSAAPSSVTEIVAEMGALVNP